MSHWRALSSEFISAVEFGDKTPTWTIASVKREQLTVLAKPGKEDAVTADDADAAKKPKGVIRFKEQERGWVLNSTNAQCLAAMWGSDVERWVGKRVTLYSKIIPMPGGKTEPGIRVKGSPDLAAPLDATIVLPRRRPQTVTLVPTGKGA